MLYHTARLLRQLHSIPTRRSSYLRVDCIHAYDAVRTNSAFLNFLSQKNIPLHIYNYYGGYSGSYFPKDALPNGNLLKRQCVDWDHPAKSLTLAKELVRGAAHNMRHNIRYAVARNHVEDHWLDRFDTHTVSIEHASTKQELLGHEGNLRTLYYSFLEDRKSTRLNSSHVAISYAVFCVK